MSDLAHTPEPPYYAVIFTSRRTGEDEGYGLAAAEMLRLAAQQPGFLGVETAHTGLTGVTVSYWESLEAIRSWREHAVHQRVQQAGRDKWYEAYELRIARVESARSFLRRDEAGTRG